MTTFIARFTIAAADAETWTPEDIAMALDYKWVDADSTVWPEADFALDLAELAPTRTFFLTWEDNLSPAFRRLQATDEDTARQEAYAFLRGADDGGVQGVLCELRGDGSTWAERLSRSDWADDEEGDDDGTQ